MIFDQPAYRVDTFREVVLKARVKNQQLWHQKLIINAFGKRIIKKALIDVRAARGAFTNKIPARLSNF